MPPADFGMSLLLNYHRSPSFFAFGLNSVGVDQRRVAAEALFDQVVIGTLIPVIDGIVALETAAEALRRIIAGEIFGKLVLHIDA